MAGVVSLFRSRRTGRVWAKRFRTASKARRAAKGLLRSGRAKPLAGRVRRAKGFKFGRVVRRLNQGR